MADILVVGRSAAGTVGQKWRVDAAGSADAVRFELINYAGRLGNAAVVGELLRNGESVFEEADDPHLRPD